MKYFTDDSYIADQIIDWTSLHGTLSATSRDGVEQKYLYASLEIKRLISEGKITYEKNKYGNVTDVDYNQKDINKIYRVLNQIDKRN